MIQTSHLWVTSVYQVCVTDTVNMTTHSTSQKYTLHHVIAVQSLRGLSQSHSGCFLARVLLQLLPLCSCSWRHCVDLHSDITVVNSKYQAPRNCQSNAGQFGDHSMLVPVQPVGILMPAWYRAKGWVQICKISQVTAQVARGSAWRKLPLLLCTIL